MSIGVRKAMLVHPAVVLRFCTNGTPKLGCFCYSLLYLLARGRIKRQQYFTCQVCIAYFFFVKVLK